MSGRTVWQPGESWKTGSEAKRQRQAAYIEWLLTPEAERTIRTKQELADEMGVSTQTLRNYAADPFVQSELARRSRSLARVERVQPVLDSLYEQATDPGNPRSVSAAKTLLDWIDKALDHQEATDVGSMSDEELYELLKAVETKLVNG